MGQSALRNAVVLFKAIYLRSNGPNFSDVQVTITEKICDCGPNSPEITESLPGCYNGKRIYSKAGANSHPVPLFEYAKKLYLYNAAKVRKKPIQKKFSFFRKKK